jgi:predicted nuclease of predicted toxin-antitoxin system
MARLYTNENFPLPTVEELRRRGHDVQTTEDTGHAHRATPDVDVLAVAQAEQRILVSLNRRHFVRLHHEQPQHSGIIVCTVDPDFGALAQRIDDVLRRSTSPGSSSASTVRRASSTRPAQAGSSV